MPDGRRSSLISAGLVKELARQAGFDRCGIAAAEPLGRAGYLRDWLAAGCAGQMRYLASDIEARDDPGRLLDGARSVICLAADYHDAGPDDLSPPPPGAGYVARYARGPDYHRTLKQMAGQLIDQLRQAVAAPFEAVVCVDTAPLLERELAARAGLGWIGKNTMLIHPQAGSYCLLAEIVTTLPIAPDAPLADHCGRCHRCLDVCPTGALAGPHRMDASRCISYLTIELRGSVPADLRERVGPHLFGCDLCQAVCPFNRRRERSGDQPTGEEAVRPAGENAAGPGGDQARPGLPAWLDLHQVANWSGADYRAAVAGTSARRATRAMFRRNAALALAGQSGAASQETLRRLAGDDDPIVAEHARWALGKLSQSAAGGPGESPP